MRTTPAALVLSLMLGSCAFMTSAWAAGNEGAQDNQPKIKVYGNKTPTMIGTPEEVAAYRQELAKQEAQSRPGTYTYVDENGNTVTVQSGTSSSFGVGLDAYYYYGGNGYYPGGQYPGGNYPGHRPPPPPPGTPVPPDMPMLPDPPPPPGTVITPPPPPAWAPTSPNVPLEPPPGGFPTPSLP